jgi:nucleotide-binding universal stress UspA family protein
VQPIKVPRLALGKDLDDIHTKDGLMRAVVTILQELGFLPKSPTQPEPQLKLVQKPTIGEVDEEKSEAEHRLAPAIAQARERAKDAGVGLHVHIVPGHIVTAIVEFIKANGIDLLVVGFIGHSQLYERIIGGTADRLVRLAPCAVLVVK